MQSSSRMLWGSIRAIPTPLHAAPSATRSPIFPLCSRRSWSTITSASRFDPLTRIAARVVVVLFVLAVAACDRGAQQFQTTDVTGATFGKQLELTDHSGERRTLADFKGKVVA